MEEQDQKQQILKLQPEAVWRYFWEVCSTPRSSGKEEKLKAYLIDQAKKLNLEYQELPGGNLVIYKGATSAAMQKKPTVILQGHMDMVTVKPEGSNHDFTKDPIIPLVEGSWVKAKGSSLGADNGIGVALALAVLSEQNLAHPKLQALFTTEEETGMGGAFALREQDLAAEVFLNLDTEEFGAIFIGCTGSLDTQVDINLPLQKKDPKLQGYEVKVSGLKGGHSGVDIHEGRLNAVKILSYCLLKLKEKFNYQLGEINGGIVRNAIPPRASAQIFLLEKDFPEVQAALKAWQEEFATVALKADAALQVSLKPLEGQTWVLEEQFAQKLLHSLNAVINGLQSINWQLNITKTSTNLGVIKTDLMNKKMVLKFMHRADYPFELDCMTSSVKSAFVALAEFTSFTSAGSTPGWPPAYEKSKMIQVAKEVYKKLYQEEVVLKALHAGLECGIFLAKNPKLDIISLGPTIKDPHSTSEALEIVSVAKTWEFLKEILANVPDKA